MRCWLRNLLYLLALFLAAPWLLRRRLKATRHGAGLRQKILGPRAEELNWGTSPMPEQTPRIWLHGVSVGEIQLLQPLLDELRRRHPTAHFAVSTTTFSGMQLARKLMPSEVPLFYFPWDFSWAVRRTLDVVRPTLLVLGELELWPNLIEFASRQGIPIAVVNGRLSERSFVGYQRWAWLTRSMFSKLSLVAAQNETYAHRFRACGAVRNTRVTGCVKFDNVAFDRQHPQVLQLRKLVGLLPQHRVWLVGSTQSPEELAAAEAWQELRQQYPMLKLIIVPRHPDRFDEVHEQLRQTQAQTRIVRRSAIQDTPLDASDWDIVLVDSVGELKWWWGVAELALVGGSFGRRGGQNMLEPAAYGANVAFGPHTKNFRDIVELLLAAEGATRLAGLEALRPWLQDELRDPRSGRERGQRARAVIATQQGALRRTVEALEPFVLSGLPSRTLPARQGEPLADSPNPRDRNAV
ncbi:MAG: 3-deoxy-D-manno-octulosonic acid transferase [Planctomycetales bacterium]|nr:3-deoxy-D-manno-octulosonic acid transferase [Planctomycetales bacterium]